MKQTAIPCVFMRSGTSKGPKFLADDVSRYRAVRDRVLLAVMGSPDARQIDGLGGADSLTSKVAIVSKSARPDADVDYLFAQVKINQPFVDVAPNCGNMLSGVGPFAIEHGLVPVNDGETTVRIYNVNTAALIHAAVRTPGRQVQYDGDVAIDGVPGTGARFPQLPRRGGIEDGQAPANRQRARRDRGHSGVLRRSRHADGDRQGVRGDDTAYHRGNLSPESECAGAPETPAGELSKSAPRNRSVNPHLCRPEIYGVPSFDQRLSTCPACPAGEDR